MAGKSLSKDREQQRNGADRPSKGPLSGSELEDYYQLFDLRPGYTDLQLLRRFLRLCQQAVDERDEALLSRIRQGFEVLRYEDTRISYYRMHRLLIRKDPLHFPIQKQHEMLQDIRSKEFMSAGQTSPVIAPGSSYFMIELKVLTGIVLLDLERLFSLGASGVTILIALPILIMSQDGSWSSIGISALLGAWGLYVLKLRASDYVTYPATHQG